MRVVEEVGAEMEIVAMIRAGGIARGRNRDAFVSRNRDAGKLRNQPAVGKLIVKDDRVTGAIHTPKTTIVYDADGNTTSQTVADLTGGDAFRTTSATFNSHDQQDTATARSGSVAILSGADTTSMPLSALNCV